MAAIDIAANPYRKDFPLLVQQPNLAFLDSAATTQRPKAVLDAQRHFYETMNANPLRGLYKLSVEATEAIDKTRKDIAAFIGATDGKGKPQGNEIVFTRNASESLNLVAHTLGKKILKSGDEVVISIMEHHSNLIPWQQICKETGAKLVYLRLDKDFKITPEEIEKKITDKTKIVSVTQLSNVLGVSPDIKAIAKRAHEVGAYVGVDGAQSVPHTQVNVRDLGIDYLAFSPHKLEGPMGIGVLWGKMDLLNSMPPFLTGGEMIDSVTEQDAVWAPVPQKFEAGTQDAAGIYATDAAIKYLTDQDFTKLEAREHALTHYLVEQLEALPFIQIVGPRDPDRHLSVVSFNVKDIHPHDVASLLDMKDVAIRAGHHCAQPLMTSMGISSSCRASVAFYNDKKDIDQLVDGLNYVWQVFHGTK